MAESPKIKSDAKERAYTTFGVPQGRGPSSSIGLGYASANVLTPEQRELYGDMLSYADNVQQSLAIQDQLAALKNTPAASEEFRALNLTAFDELQSKLRRAGFSKATTQIGSGIWSLEDTKGFIKVLQNAFENNVNFETVLDQRISEGPVSQEPSVTFSKTISQALTLMDKDDAKATLSRAMYESFGYFPSQKQIADFEKKWNAEAQKQASQTTTSSTTTRAGKGQSATKISGVTVGKGFTEAEQSQFLAQYLKDQFNVKKELGGKAKQLYDVVADTYRNNLLPIPSFDKLTAQVLKLIGTGDADVEKQMLSDMQTKVRRQAKALYPGWSEYLDQGDDLMEYASNYAQFASKKLGRDVKSDEEIVRKIMSFSDIKGPRPASSQEITRIIESTNEWQGSSEAKSAYIGLADMLTRGL